MIPFSCPACNETVELRDDWDFVLIDCPHCGVKTNLMATSDAAELRRGDVLLHFELKQLLGTGGNGTVWRAHDRELQRDVAIKFPSRDIIEAKDRVRFLREASLAARVKHPHIVPILHVGEDPLTRPNGGGFSETLPKRLYIISELIVGMGLDRFIKIGKRSAPAKVARLIERLADALGAAHSATVIHRDVKPSNVMLDSKGKPYLLDFGVSKSSDQPDRTISREGAIIGSPFYLSPEQARGENTSLDVRSDIYSLGVLFFEMLTGRLPFEGSEKEFEHATADLKRDVPSPRLFTPALPRDLETICRKCLEKYRELRFANGRELAEELKRYRDGVPILSRPISSFERFTRWCHRKPVIAGLSASMVTTTIVGLIVALALQNSRWRLQSEVAAKTSELKGQQTELVAKDQEIGAKTVQLQQTEAERMKQAAEAARKKREAYLNRYLADLRLARDYWSTRELNNLKALLEQHLPSRTQQEDARGFEWFYWWSLLNGGDEDTDTALVPLDHDLLSAAVSDNGQWVAVGHRLLGMMLVQVSDGTVTLNNQRGESCSPIAISSDGQYIATSAGNRDTIRIWNQKGREVATFTGLSYPVLRMAFSPNGQLLASSGHDFGPNPNGEVIVWDIDAAAPLQLLLDPRTQHLTSLGNTAFLTQANTSGLGFSPDGETLWTSGGRSTSQGDIPEQLLAAWDVRRGTLRSLPKSRPSGGGNVIISHDNKTLWVGNGRIEQWSLSVPDNKAKDPKKLAVSVLPNSTGFTRELQVPSFGSLSLSPDDRWLVTTNRADEVLFVETVSGMIQQAFKGHTAEIKAVAALQDDRGLSIDRNGVIKEWKVGGHAAGERTLRFAQDTQRSLIRRTFTGIQFAGEELLAIESFNGKCISVWNETTRQNIEIAIDAQRFQPEITRLSRDGRRALVHGFDRTKMIKRTRVFEIKTNTEIPPQDDDEAVSTASSGQVMTIYSGDGTRRLDRTKARSGFVLVDAITNKELCVLKFREQHPQLRAVTLNQDGSLIYGIPNSAAAIVTVWDGLTGEIRHEYRTRGIELMSLALSPDGFRLAAGGDVKTADSDEVRAGGVRLWDTRQHEEVLSLPTGFRVNTLVFSPSGRQLAAASGFGPLVIWRGADDPERKR